MDDATPLFVCFIVWLLGVGLGFLIGRKAPAAKLEIVIISRDEEDPADGWKNA